MSDSQATAVLPRFASETLPAEGRWSAAWSARLREHLFQVIIAPPQAGHKPGRGHGPSRSLSPPSHRGRRLRKAFL